MADVSPSALHPQIWQTQWMIIQIHARAQRHTQSAPTSSTVHLLSLYTQGEVISTQWTMNGQCIT